MWTDDLDWLELTYPVRQGGAVPERAEEAERVCLRRLEAIWWPQGPQCPKCGSCDDAAEWSDAPRGIGWRCRRCKARFHILQAIPPMARTHQPVSLWFRAIFLISNSQRLSSIALGERLGLEQKIAWKLGRTIRQMQADYPDLVRRIVGGPAADNSMRRKPRKPTTARKASVDTTRSEPPRESEPPMALPGAFDPDC